MSIMTWNAWNAQEWETERTGSVLSYKPINPSLCLYIFFEIVWLNNDVFVEFLSTLFLIVFLKCPFALDMPSINKRYKV